MFLRCLNYMACFENSFESNSGWRNWKSIFSTVHQPVMVSKIRSQVVNEELESWVVDRGSTLIDVDDYTEGKETDRSSVAIFFTEVCGEMSGSRAIKAGRMRMECKRRKLQTWKRRTEVRKQVRKQVRREISWRQKRISFDMLYFNWGKMWFRLRKML